MMNNPELQAEYDQQIELEQRREAQNRGYHLECVKPADAPRMVNPRSMSCRLCSLAVVAGDRSCRACAYHERLCRRCGQALDGVAAGLEIKTMSKHTEGPWSIHAYADKHRGEDWREIRSPAGFVVLVDTFTITRGGEVEHYSGVRISEADARLIAAAPDLLAACQALRAELADYTDHDRSLDHWNAAIIRADRAIKKATE